MAIPTVISQLITLVYNIADTWFIGQTDNPYMVAASSLVLTVFLMTTALANLFGVGGGSLVVRLLGAREEEEARKVASLSLVMAAGGALAFSLICLVFMDPLLRLLGASDNTIGYARQYLLFVVVIGGLPTVLSNTMSAILRNVGFSKEAGFGLGLGGVLNVLLDPLFMFVLLPAGYEVMGAAIATMLSNFVAFGYFLLTYRRVKKDSILALPRRIERIRRDSMGSIFSVGVPAAMSLLLYDLTNMVINRLSSTHGDIELAAIGIVLKVERLPLNIGVGICLGMMPLIAYNYATGNHKRMKAFFSGARLAGIVVSVLCVALYRIFAPWIIRAFISDGATVGFGTEFLQARCFATPFMFLSFHMVHFMQAIDRGKCSLWLAVIRQLCLNIPMLFLLNRLFGMSGIVWTQMTADAINVVISYIIYSRVIRTVRK
ncbi:MAG: polysaccharide biosynthesis C-terminal domain-containing protein [Oscillospiraceae bacterium]|nr:polysaccharide biosynthesis C-terminal domain-containing protein [Oscillospiraceae bacterium]